MDNGINKQFEPVCRFGPGGDFISIWPVSSESQLPLWKSRCAFEDVETEKHVHQLSAMRGGGHPFSGAQPTLFPDDDQISLKVSHRPVLRTTARRRTTVKHLRVDASRQHLLFATDIKIARTA